MDKPEGSATLGYMRRTLLALPLAALALLGADAPKEAKQARPSDGSHWQKAYPAAKAGYRRVVIHLEAKPSEDDWRVEVVVGRMMETDGVNRVGLVGRIEEKTVQGWGYTYLEAPESKGTFSTKIGVPPGQPMVRNFVTLPSFGPFRYNSKLPVVVYVPEGYEVRYRVWQADKAWTKGDEG
jgi:ecotin